MSLEISIEGSATLKQVVDRMRAAGRKDLSREMSTALSRVVVPVKASIDVEAGKAMPSGYRSLLTGSLRHRMSRRNGGNQARILLTTYADGKSERREVRSLEAGKLRHPLFGRKKKWYITVIPPGFHKRGTENAMDDAMDAMHDVVQDFARKLIS